jgi:hypothetical protein
MQLNVYWPSQLLQLYLLFITVKLCKIVCLRNGTHRIFFSNCNLNVFVTIFFYRQEFLAPSPIPKLEDNPLSTVHDCLFISGGHLLCPQPEDVPCRGDTKTHCFSCLLSKDIKIGMYRTIILPVVLYGHETCSLRLRE